MIYHLENLNFLKNLIRDWEISPGHEAQIDGIRYYEGEHDIKYPNKKNGKTRYTLLNGQRYPMSGVVNNIIVDNMYAQMVKQKVNYLFSKPMVVECENKEHEKKLKEFLGKKFLSIMKNLATEFINCGIAYLHPFYNRDGVLDFEIFSGAEILPIWGDQAHKFLDSAIRVYTIKEQVGDTLQAVKYATVFLEDTMKTYKLEEHATLFMMESPYVVSENPLRPFRWGKIPLIPFKSNSKEIPLIQQCKSIQDSLNFIESVYLDVLSETGDTTLLAISGGGVEKPLELRKNITEYRLMYLKNMPGVDSDIKAIQMETKKENYELMIKILRRSLVENCHGFEMKDEKTGGSNFNEMNIKSMYVSLDLDANNIETEFQYSMTQLLYFLNVHFQNHHLDPVNIDDVTIITDRDTIVNTESQIAVANSVYGKVSLPTYLSQLSFVDNVQEELERIQEEGTYEAFIKQKQGLGNLEEARAEEDERKIQEEE